jgi:hypothetical protein
MGAEATLPSLSHKFLNELQSRGAIIGPHGTGKTTLLVHLLPLIGQVRYRHCIDQLLQINESPEANLVWLQLRAKHQPWRTILNSRPHWGRGRILILDGFEQLSWLARLWVIFATRLRESGLLVTAHKPVALPTLYRTNMALETAIEVIRHVHPEWHGDELQASELRQLLRKHHQNLREVMMEMYDAFEQRTR